MILSVGLCEGGALHLAQRLAPSAKLNLILAKFYEVLIYCLLQAGLFLLYQDKRKAKHLR
ncbi:MAG: hypothetical protein LCH32_13550 [Bacteroidetes bacterium]|nr:hypothetical protein [Bacteroidota bacterium]